MIERLTMMTVRSIRGNGNTRNDSPESSHLGIRSPMDLHGSISSRIVIRTVLL